MAVNIYIFFVSNCRGLGMAGNAWKQLVENGWKWMEIAKHGYKRLEMAGIDYK